MTTIRVSSYRAAVGAALLALLASVSLGAGPSRKSVPAQPDAATVQSHAVELKVPAVDHRAAPEGLSPVVPARKRPVVASINSGVYDLAMQAAACAVRAGDVRRPETLTVIDYSRPSSTKRLWVFEFDSGRLLHEEFVAHGQGSGGDVPTKFSNKEESHQSSIGLFVAQETYIGKHGYSLRLNGLEDGFNDRARERAIVVHGASYVSDAFVKAQGRLGRSWGCPAVRQGVVRELIDDVKGGGLLFAYYPDEEWLDESDYLDDCDAAD